MKIKTLWQKWDDVIELAVAVDEFVDECNPDHWVTQCRAAREQHPDAEVRIINIEIPWCTIEDAFKTIEIKV